jgi:hypothetical protein
MVLYDFLMVLMFVMILVRLLSLKLLLFEGFEVWPGQMSTLGTMYEQDRGVIFI